MLFFTNQKSISTVKRQVYTGDKSTYTTVLSSQTGYLRPLTEEQASANGLQYGTAYALIVETSVDIREGDKVTIDSIEYTVRGMVNHDRGGICAYKRIVMTKPEKA